MPIEGTVQENSQGTYDAYEGAFTLLESADVTMAQEGAKAVDEATTTSLAEFPGQPRIEIVSSSPIWRSGRGVTAARAAVTPLSRALRLCQNTPAARGMAETSTVSPEALPMPPWLVTS